MLVLNNHQLTAQKCSGVKVIFKLHIKDIFFTWWPAQVFGCRRSNYLELYDQVTNSWTSNNAVIFASWSVSLSCSINGIMWSYVWSLYRVKLISITSGYLENIIKFGQPTDREMDTWNLHRLRFHFLINSKKYAHLKEELQLFWEIIISRPDLETANIFAGLLRRFLPASYS